MKNKIALILKIVGCVGVFAVVGYDLLWENPSTEIYWVGVIIGCALIIAGRIIESIGPNADDDND